jgi:hypothetical protein
MEKILYSAVVLDDKSREKLLAKVKQLIPNNYEVIAHHMTIKLGELYPDQKKLIGLRVRLTVDAFGKGDKVLAVKCHADGIKSDNETPHITIAVDRANGGKPVMSNQITKWYPINRPLLLTGVVTEIKAN